MKIFNVTTTKTYEKDGVEKKTYPRIGKLIQFPATTDKPESFILELNMFPETKFGVYPDEPRAQSATVKDDF